ncbi:MAG: hypothetical protein LUE93_01925 [Bacteroides sp.]|nr:hypothetical protein [Bacteroides sp.]
MEMQKALEELRQKGLTTVLLRDRKRIDRFAGKLNVDQVPESKDPEQALREYVCDKPISPAEVLYIGNSTLHREEAASVGVDFGMVLWNGGSVKHIKATWYFTSPREMVYTLCG